MNMRAMGLTALAAAALAANPGAVAAQANPALIGEGALTWGNNCGRCHHVRPTAERSDAEWVTIVMHMRARANLTRHQGDAVLAYLQATNMAEPSAGGGAATPTDPDREAPASGARQPPTGGPDKVGVGGNPPGRN